MTPKVSQRWLDQWLLIVRSLESLGVCVEQNEHLIEGLLAKLPASIQTQVGLQCDPDHEWTITSLHNAIERLLKVRRSTDQRLCQQQDSSAKYTSDDYQFFSGSGESSTTRQRKDIKLVIKAKWEAKLAASSALRIMWRKSLRRSMYKVCYCCQPDK